MVQPIAFHQQLLQKLQLSNRNSIHLNALPNNSLRRIDIWELSKLEDNFHYKFIQEIIEKEECKFNVEVKLDTLDKRSENFEILSALKKKLDNIYFDDQELFKDKGYHSFGLGFPMLIKREKNNPEKLIKAPIFIFKLNIQKSSIKHNTFVISKTDDAEVELNPLLLNYLKSNEQLNLHFLQEQIENAETFDYALFQHILKQFCDSLSIPFDSSILHVAQAPEKNVLQSIDNSKDLIRYCGTLALYEMPKQSIIEELQHVIENYDAIFKLNSLEWKIKEDDFALPLISTDPSQSQIVHNIEQNPRLIVQGPPGTGKSRLLTSIISKALLNGKKTLVICEKLTAFEVLKDNLKSIGLDNQVQIIEDITQDRTAVVTKIRQQIDEQNLPHNIEELKQQLLKIQDKFQKHFNNLNHRKEKIFEPLHDGKNFKQLVLEYLQALHFLGLKNEDISSLKSFEEIVYENADEVLKNAETLYRKAFDAINDFQPLQENVFSSGNFSSIFLQIQAQLPKLIQEIEKLKKMLETLYPKEFQFVENTLKQEYAFVKENIEKIASFDKENVQEFGVDYENFNLEKSAWQKVSSMFSSKINRSFEAKLQMKTLSESFNEKTKNFIFLKESIHIDARHIFNSSIQDIQEKIQKYSIDVLLKDYFDRTSISAYKSDEKNDVLSHLLFIKSNPENSSFNLNFLEQKNILSLLHESKLYSEKLMLMQQKIHLFQAVFEYKSYCKTLPIELQQIIEYFQDKTQWQSLFQAKRYQNLLLKNDTAERQYSVQDLELLNVIFEEYAKAGISYTQALWSLKRKTALDNALSLQKNIKNVYALRNTSKRKKLSLRKILHYDIDFFTDYNPVLMLNPSVAAALLPYVYQYFDYIIFDEASQLKLEDVYTALQRAKKVIITGDSQQMPPSEYFATSSQEQEDETDDLSQSVSLLEFAENEKFEQFYLDFHYRSKNPDLIQFSNAAFYNSRLLPLPAVSDAQSLCFIDVQGKYDAKNGVNETEINAIVNVLLQKISTEKSVGIASLNMFQRDAILQAIEQAKKESKSNAEKLLQLEHNGLFVKNLENIQGDERDLIIISTTFGVDEQGNFKQFFGPINQAKGYKLLNVLITRAKEKVYLINSIPDAALQTYQQLLNDKGNVGKGLFYAYASYVKYCTEGNEIMKNAVLQQLKNNNLYASNFSSSTEAKFDLEKHYSQTLDNAESPYKLGGLNYGILYKNSFYDIDGEQNIADKSINFELHKMKIARQQNGVYNILFSNRIWLYDNSEMIFSSVKS